MSGYEAIKKRKMIRRRIKRVVTSLLLIVVFILWGIYALLQSDFFNLKHVDILGNETIQQEELLQYSQLVMNRNLFKYKLDEIKEKIETHPYVKEVTVERKLSGRLIIKVKERSEYAIITYMGSYIYIDKEGVVLRVSDSELSHKLPLITGAEFKSFNVGEAVDVINLQDLVKVIKVLEAANLTEMADTISEVNIAEPENIKLITFDGIEVHLGSAENPAYLMLTLKEVLVNLYTINRRDVIIDLRYEGHITVKDRNI